MSDRSFSRLENGFSTEGKRIVSVAWDSLNFSRTQYLHNVNLSLHICTYIAVWYIVSILYNIVLLLNTFDTIFFEGRIFSDLKYNHVFGCRYAQHVACRFFLAPAEISRDLPVLSHSHVHK